MSTLYTFCEKCDLKVPVKKESLAKGITCPGCGDLFTPKKINQADDAGRYIAGVAVLGILAGLILVVISLFNSAWAVPADACLGTGLILFVIAQLIHIRAALEKLAGK